MVLRRRRQTGGEGEEAVPPRYYLFRLFLFPLLLSTLTIGSVMILLGVRSLPSLVSRYPGLLEAGFLETLSEEEVGVGEYLERYRPEHFVTTVNRTASLSLVLSLGAFAAVNLPFRRYFSLLRRGRAVPPRLRAFCRRMLVHTPYINGALFLAPFLLLFSVIWILELRYGGQLPEMPDVNMPLEGYRNLRYLMLVSGLLSALFVMVWQRHRVRLHYITAVFSPEELRSRGRWTAPESVRGRLWLSSVTTTLLPFATVAMYVVLSFSVVQDFGQLPRTKQEVLLGRYSVLVEQLGLEEEFYRSLQEAGRRQLPPLLYINVVDTLQMIAGVAGGLTAAFIYLFFFVRWTSADVVGPVRELLRRMEQAKRGELEVYARVRSGDELGELGEGFNAMLDGLQERERIKGLFGQYLTPEVSEEILSGRVDVEGELFEATVLFTDIRGFTGRAEEMEPQGVVRLLNEYFERMIAVVQQHGGIIDKFLGDGLLAVFGVPVKREDHAARGIRAALAMHEELRRMNREREQRGSFPISIGAGLHSGRVIAGNLGSSRKLEYTVIGDTVNLASRIEGLNKRFGSSLVISADSFARLPEELREGPGWSYQMNVRIRGKSEPVDVYTASVPQ